MLNIFLTIIRLNHFWINANNIKKLNINFPTINFRLKKKINFIKLRVLLAYFAVAGLDVMNKLDKLPHTKQAIIDWIYNHQIAETIDSIYKYNNINKIGL